MNFRPFLAHLFIYFDSHFGQDVQEISKDNHISFENDLLYHIEQNRFMRIYTHFHQVIGQKMGPGATSGFNLV